MCSSAIRLFWIALFWMGWNLQGEQQDHNQNAWFSYFGDHPLSGGPWGLHFDAQLRRSDLGAEPMQVLVQPGLNYQCASGWQLAAGYGFMETSAYGHHPVPVALPEHRFWQQASRTSKLGSLSLQHRFRVEQRFLGQNNQGIQPAKVDSYRYENRLSYRLATTLPLKALGCDKLYFKISDEVFVNLGEQVLGNHFDQNRAYVALGRPIGKHGKLELGFMEQTLQMRGGNVFQNNHTLMISFFSDWPFGSLQK